MSVNCELAQILLKKFGYLEKRVTYLEGKSRRQQNLMEKLQKKKKLKMTTTIIRNQGKLSQEKPVANPKPELIEEDPKINRKLVIRMGVRCDEESRKILNPVEKRVENGHSIKVSQIKTDPECTRNNERGVETSKLKRSAKKSQICNFCSKSFQHFADLSSHMRVHTGERPFKCKICSKSFTQIGNLKRHSLLHTGEKPFSCSVCSKAFTQNSNLKDHMRFHTGERPFSCSVCSRAFAYSSTLKRHVRVHTGEKPYSCSFCSKTFAQIHHRNDHIRAHLGEKPYSCFFCSQSFLHIQSRNGHIRTHIGERPYSCSVCSKTFAQSSGLFHHRKVHAGSIWTQKNLKKRQSEKT